MIKFHQILRNIFYGLLSFLIFGSGILTIIAAQIAIIKIFLKGIDFLTKYPLI